MGIHSPSSRRFNRLENILIIGNGGRENSLAWAIQKNDTIVSLDKDRFRNDLGGLIEAYSEINRRINDYLYLTE